MPNRPTAYIPHIFLISLLDTVLRQYIQTHFLHEIETHKKEEILERETIRDI